MGGVPKIGQLRKFHLEGVKMVGGGWEIWIEDGSD
jgi:hypothetical protein